MFELAPLAAISDIETASTAIKNGAIVVYLGDPLSKPEPLNNALNGSELVPDYTLLQILINGDLVGFEKCYYDKLTMSTNSFVNIFNFMYNKKTVILFFPIDAMNLRYPEILLRFFRSYYGVQAATKSTEFQYNPSNYNLQVNLLIARIISDEEFIMNMDYIDDRGISILHNYWDDDFPEFRKMNGPSAVSFIDKKKEEIKLYGHIIRSVSIENAFQRQSYGDIILP